MPDAPEGSPSQGEVPARARTRQFSWGIFILVLMMGCAPTLFTCVLPFFLNSEESLALGLLLMFMIFLGLPVWGLLLVIVGVISVFLRGQPAFKEIGWGCAISLIIILVLYTLVKVYWYWVTH